MFSGSITALVTPFNQDGSLDEDSFVKHINWQIENGTNGFVPVGTTGESPTLSHDEHKRVVELCVEVVKKRVPVIAGAGSNNTEEAIDFLEHASSVGADAGLIVTPYYNKPTQEGMYQHFKVLNDVSNIPLLIYNIPGRCIVDMSIETMTRLSKLKNIVGVKDATADLSRTSLQRHAIGKDFIQLSGEDMTALALMAHGGHGCISVTSNVAPKLCADFQKACLMKDYDNALELQDKLTPLHKALFIETSPGPVKYALSLLGFCNDVVRLPLVNISSDTKRAVKEAMEFAGLI
ncbi:MAG: 4-hydroxy-tetrahydrodipicolinate synthase [Hyphomicrobiales bacterium]